jgi:hypothetical protein
LLIVKLEMLTLVEALKLSHTGVEPLVEKTLSAAPGSALPDQLFVLVHEPLAAPM